MKSVCKKGPEQTGKQGGLKHRRRLSALILRLCFAGRVRAALCGRRESGGSDAPARCGRDPPCVQQQGQRPHGVCGQGPCEQPSPAALKGGAGEALGPVTDSVPVQLVPLLDVFEKPVFRRSQRSAHFSRSRSQKKITPPPPRWEIFRFMLRLNLCIMSKLIVWV